VRNLQHLRKQIDSATDLLSVVRTMKTLAAVNIRQFQRAAEAIEMYDESVQRGLQSLLGRHRTLLEGREAPRHRTGLVVFGSDQGMCGAFNERIRAAVETELKDILESSDEVSILVVGKRVGPLLDLDGSRVDEVLALPNSVPGIPDFVRRLLGRLDKWRDRLGIDRVVSIHNSPVESKAGETMSREILPVDPAFLQRLAERPWPTRQQPHFSMSADALFSELIREHLFVSWYRACAESLAAENGARLSSMRSAQSNIEERLVELRGTWRRRRQSKITSELLEIIAGSEAQRGDLD